MSKTVYKEFSSPVAVWKYFLKAEDLQTAKFKLYIKLNDSTKESSTSQAPCDDARSAFTTSSPSTSNSSVPLPVSSALSTSVKKRKISDHFPKEENNVEKKVSRMVFKDGLPFRVFCTSSDLRELFKASGYNLPTSPNSVKRMVMNYGSTLKYIVIQDLLKLKENDLRLTLTFDEWTSARNRRYININDHALSQKKKNGIWG
ncbi:unnamed protein product [Euphydryas editha]|uniref:Transposase n=1 Tax=Euphydryas editha TaxID=104508 RepID=A0AAU9UHK0_EUPED|nr:unnamed protein product [Euphydryas editha]